MTNVPRLVLYAAVAAMLMLLTGCATKQVDLNRYFWPPLPDQPRIEWLNAYQTEADVKDPGLFDTIVGDNPMALSRPVSAASDGAGRIYVSDHIIGGVVLIDTNKKEMKYLGGETAGSFFNSSSGVAVDGEGNLYAGDSVTGKLMVFDKNGVPTRVIDMSKHFKTIGYIAIDKARNRLIVPDVRGHKIYVLDLNGKILNSTGIRGGGDGEFNYPTAVAVDREGNIIVCDSLNARIQRLTPDLKFISKFGKRGDSIGEFNVIKGVAVDSEGHIYITDGKANSVGIYNEQGEILLSFGGTFLAQQGLSVTPGGFLLPQGIYIDQNDTIYVADQMNSRIQVFQYLNEKYLKEHPVSAKKTAK